jgi:hypothetical protein
MVWYQLKKEEFIEYGKVVPLEKLIRFLLPAAQMYHSKDIL